MKEIKGRSNKKRSFALLFVFIALSLAVRFAAGEVEAAATEPPTALAQATPTPVIRGRHNGKIVFTSDRHNDALNICTMNPDGSSSTRLTQPTPRNPRLPITTRIYDDFPAWSPDGTKIAFLSNRSCGETGNLDCLRTIHIMNADGSNPRSVLVEGIQESLKEIRSPVWSPDGTRFAFSAGSHFTIGTVRQSTNIYVTDIEGKNTVKLTHDTSVVNINPTWSPDSKQIAFESNRDTDFRRKIWVINADGINLRRLTDVHNVSDIRFYSDLMPSWSPDGTKIVFVGHRDDNGAIDCDNLSCGQVHVMDADGSNEKRLTNGFNDGGLYLWPRWSPDGTKIVVTRDLSTPDDDRNNIDRGQGIFVMNADGSNQIKISNRSDVHPTDAVADWQPLNEPANPPPPAVLGLSASAYSAFEDSGSVPVTVTRTGNLNEAVTCLFSTGEGTATLQHNYTPILRSLRFAPGEVSQEVLIPLTDNGHALGDRNFKVELLDNEGNATFVGGTRVATLTVRDRDSAPRALNPIDDARVFVRQHYVDFLTREPDPNGLAFWRQEIEGCGSDARCLDVKKQNVSAAFFLSIEFQETGYFFLRFRVLNPHITTGGFRGFLRGVQALNRGVIVGQGNWQDQLEANKRAYVQQFFDDERVIPSFGFTNEGFVNQLFMRSQITPTQAERDALIAALDAGTETRPSVFRKILEDERFIRKFFNAAFVQMQCHGYLRRDPDAPGFNFWLAKLDSHNGNFLSAQMVKAFLVSGEYRDRFGK